MLFWIVFSVSVGLFALSFVATIRAIRQANAYRAANAPEGYFGGPETAYASDFRTRKGKVMYFVTFVTGANIMFVLDHFPAIPSLGEFALEILVALIIGFMVLFVRDPLNPFSFFEK